MKSLSTVLIVLVLLVGSAGGLYAADRENGQDQYTIYDHAEGEHRFRLVVPNGLKVVRGILVVGPYSGGDSRDYHEQVWYREFLNLHGFAFLGATNYYLHDYSVMQAALKRLANDTKHPELASALCRHGLLSRRRVHTKADESRSQQGHCGGSRGIDDEAGRRNYG